MVHRIYPAERQLNNANASDTEAAILDLNLSTNNDTVSIKIYDKRDVFDFDIGCPSASLIWCLCISTYSPSSHISDFNSRTYS